MTIAHRRGFRSVRMLAILALGLALLVVGPLATSTVGVGPASMLSSSMMTRLTGPATTAFADADHIDDFTEHTYSVGAGGIGAFADFPVQRTFDKPITSIKVTIVSGQADDIGYVGSLLVTDVAPRCARVSAVVAPVDVTSQVTVSGNMASLLLRAQENCCCVTGWGSATQSDRQNARLHWEVSFEACQSNVTPLSQGGGASWADDLYDHSNTLTIRRRGCALTALTMALNFAGQSYDPGALNTFMKDNDNDFSGTSVNWDPATRDASGGTLKFFGFRESTTGRLNDALCNGHPVIVGVNLDSDGTPGHFVLVTGKQGDQFLINDPGHSDRSTLDDYGNQFVTRGYVADPPGDISALDVAAGDGVEILVIDPAARRTGFDTDSSSMIEEIPNSVYFRDQLEDDVTGEPATETGHICQIQQPLQGAYQVMLFGLAPGTFELSIRVFSQDGSAQPPIVIQGISGTGSVSTFQIQLVSPPGSTSTAARFASFDSTLGDIANSEQLGLIDNHGIAHSLSSKIEAAAAAAGRGQPETSINILGAFKNQLRAQSGKHVSAFAAEVLLEDADSLIGQMTQ